jgi:hypothetical protein
LDNQLGFEEAVLPAPPLWKTTWKTNNEKPLWNPVRSTNARNFAPAVNPLDKSIFRGTFNTLRYHYGGMMGGLELPTLQTIVDPIKQLGVVFPRATSADNILFNRLGVRSARASSGFGKNDVVEDFKFKWFTVFCWLKVNLVHAVHRDRSKKGFPLSHWRLVICHDQHPYVGYP